MVYRFDVGAHIHSCRTIMVDDSHVTHGFDIMDLRAEPSVWTHFCIPTLMDAIAMCHCNLQPTNDISKNAQLEN